MTVYVLLETSQWPDLRCNTDIHQDNLWRRHEVPRLKYSIFRTRLEQVVYGVRQPREKERENYELQARPSSSLSS
jgi:hypothetical protein